MTRPGAPAIVKLHPGLDLEGFESGRPELDLFLKRHALPSQQAHGAQTYAAVLDQVVLGYYSLAVGSVAHAEAPERLRKGLAAHPVPVMLLARLAVDLRQRGKGLGAALLKDALLRTARAADIAGIRAVLVQAKDDEAAAFYRHFDFAPCPFLPGALYLLMKDLARLLR